MSDRQAYSRSRPAVVSKLEIVILAIVTTDVLSILTGVTTLHVVGNKPDALTSKCSRVSRHRNGGPYYRNHKLKLVIGNADCDRPCVRSEEHTSELQSQSNLVCRLLL